jgi:hypothetical protein
MEDDDVAQCLATVDRGDRLVDFFERVARGDQLVELQPPLLVELDQLRDVGLDVRGAHFRPQDSLGVVGEEQDVELRLHAQRWHPHEDDGAAPSDQSIRLIGGILRAHCDECEVGAAPIGQDFDSLAQVDLRRVEGVGGAKGSRGFQFVF